MSDIRVVRQQEIGYSERGDSVYSTEAYIKVLASFRKGALRILKGAPLSVFFCVACHEADDTPGASTRGMESETGYSHPTVIEAVKFLTAPEHRFIEKIGQEADGTNIFRVAAYAWFGTKAQGSSIPAEPRRDRASSIRQSPSPSGRGGKNILPPEKVLPPSVVVEVTSSLKGSDLTSTSEVRARVKKILSEAGFYGKPLDQLSGILEDERAERWARWISWAEEYARDTYRSPAGMALYQLTQDPQAEPLDDVPDDYGNGIRFGRHCLATSEPTSVSESELMSPRNDAVAEMAAEPAASPAYRERYAAGEMHAEDIWTATLGEIQLRMTKATFDTWVRPTWALGWDGDQLVVGVHSPYAIEWLEHRLDTTIKRILAGIVERPVEIRYEVAAKGARR